MRTDRITQLRILEGHQVSLALADGSRIDDSQLVSAGRSRVPTIWIFVNGTDTFVPLGDVVDVWETAAHRSTAA
ncbi:MAG: hypothetical protein QOJ23_1850 [Actinomycetota bacterium]|jgi:hypothetical protein|nr:hypothetical protein [Actinomycetota bacterium]